MRAAVLIQSVLLVGVVAASHAGVRPPAIFSDHIVVQADTDIVVWGWADAREEVTVSLAGRTSAATTGSDGRWTVKLGKFKATSEPQSSPRWRRCQPPRN